MDKLEKYDTMLKEIRKTMEAYSPGGRIYPQDVISNILTIITGRHSIKEKLHKEIIDMDTTEENMRLLDKFLNEINELK